eukprot:jgi/Chlat1/3953/Chrsp26S04204
MGRSYVFWSLCKTEEDCKYSQGRPCRDARPDGNGAADMLRWARHEACRQAMTKEYTGTLRLGEHTASYDAETLVIETKDWEHITDDMLASTTERFMGEIQQIPPMYSAIQASSSAHWHVVVVCSARGKLDTLRVNGERLYEKARRGETIAVAARTVRIDVFEVNRDPVDRHVEYQRHIHTEFGIRLCSGTG